MGRLWKLVPWLSRVLLVLASALFVFLGVKYFCDPVGTTARDSLTLGSPAAITDMRVVGSIFLACSLVTLFFLFSNQLLAGFRFVLTIVGAITLARLYGILVDGAPPTTISKLRTEVVLLIVFGGELMLETFRRRHQIAGSGSAESGWNQGMPRPGRARAGQGRAG